jgi:hypothetical protein
MSATGLSIILMAVISGAALIAAIRAEAGSSSPQIKHFRTSPPLLQRPNAVLRCLPKIIRKCPTDQKRVCLAVSGNCCVKTGCKARAK